MSVTNATLLMPTETTLAIASTSWVDSIINTTFLGAPYPPMTCLELFLCFVVFLLFMLFICSNKARLKLKSCNDEHLQTKKTLRNKIEEFNVLFNALPGFVWQKDSHGAIVTANQATCNALGFSEDDIVGKTVRDLFPPALAEEMAKQDEQLLRGKIPLLQIESLSPFSAQPKFISTRMEAFKNDDGSIGGIIGLGIDITELKLIEKELRYREALHKLIMNLAISFVNIPLDELDSAIIRVLAMAGDFAKADRAFIYTYDFDAQTIRRTHEWHAPGVNSFNRELTSLPLGHFSEWVKIHLRKEPVNIPCVQKLPKDDALRQLFEEQAVKTILTTPLIHGSRCFGFVGFDAVHEEKKWSGNEIELLTLMAELLTNTKLRQEHEYCLTQAKAAAEKAHKEVEILIQDRTRDLAITNALLQIESAERMVAISNLNLIQNAISSVFIAVDTQDRVFRWGQAAERAFSIESLKAEGALFRNLPIPWDWNTVLDSVQACTASNKKTRAVNVGYTRPDGSEGFLVLTVSPIYGDEAPGYLILGEDVTDIRLLENRLAQSAKLEAIGQLAAGIAHEINTPAQYVSDSVAFLRDYFTDTVELMDLLQTHCREGWIPADADSARLCSILSNLDLEFAAPEILGTFDRIFDGMERISTIVRAMNRFSHVSGSIKTQVDINAVIENTIIISRNEWKLIADIKTDLDPELKKIFGQVNEIGQVFLNTIINASHAIAEAVRGTSRRGTISITTRNADDGVEVRIQDTGTGIPRDIHEKIFNLFFTTKTLGKGTGQGLTIAYDIVVKKHGGRISFVSEQGQGTTFLINLPSDTATMNDLVEEYKA